MRVAEISAIRQKLLFDFNTKLLAPEGYPYAGYPNYHDWFGRDTAITALELVRFLPDIAAAVLRAHALYQAKEYNEKSEAEPGKCAHEIRLTEERRKQLPNLKFPYYGSVDSTSLFLILLKEYVDATSDEQLLRELWPNVTMAVWWHINNDSRNPYGFITYERKNPHGLFHQGWKDSFEDHLRIIPPVAIVEEQGYAYLALQSYLRLHQRLFRKTPVLYGREVQELIRSLKENFVPKFWMESEQYFALALDGNGNQRRAVTSNPGHLLMCGDFLEEKYARAIVRRLFQKDMWTIGGIRTHSEREPDFNPLSYHLGSIWPHDNWIIWHGLRLWGFQKEADKIRSALLKTYRTLGGIPECFAVLRGFLGKQKIISIQKIEQLERHNEIVGKHLASFTANPLQAWSTGALLSMLYNN